MSDSILTSTKKILGIAADYTVFDIDIITHINSVFSTLSQLGVGEDHGDIGFMIEDDTAEWGDFLPVNDPRYNAVRSYMYMRVRLMFDPPSTSYLITSMKEQVLEMEWRLNVVREVDLYPVPPYYPIIDGGDPDPTRSYDDDNPVAARSRF